MFLFYLEKIIWSINIVHIHKTIMHCIRCYMSIVTIDFQHSDGFFLIDRILL